MNTRKQGNRLAASTTAIVLPERWRALPAHLAAMNRVVYRPERLFILGVLKTAEQGVTIKKLLALTQLSPGSLSGHMAQLEAAGYVEVRKSFQGKIPTTSLVITLMGRDALAAYLEHLAAILDLLRNSDDLPSLIAAYL